MDFMNQDTHFAEETSSRKWSPNQEAIFDATKAGKAILVDAVAGSGKTTTIVEAMKHGGSRPIFLAFNKSIQEELSRRISLGEARTLNSLGFAACRTKMAGVHLDARKNLAHLEHHWYRTGLSSTQWKEFSYSASRLMGVAKNCAVGTDFGPPASVSTFRSLAEAYWLTFPEEILDSVLLAVSAAFDSSILDTSTIDFDDQLYYPVRFGWSLPSYSDAFVDECQDLSPIQHALLVSLGKMGTRIIAVGDRHQAIYGFRGASHESMDILKGLFDMTELPLSTTYRCPQLVVAEAQRYREDIYPREGAPLGYVNAQDIDPEIFPSGTMVLCRNNAPMFRAIMRHVRAKVPLRVYSNFLETFQSFIKSFKCSTTRQLRTAVAEWYERERTKAEEEEAWGKLAGIEDRFETLCVVMEGFDGVGELLDFLRSLSTGTRGPIFSTIHKAKGLEAPHVYLLRPDLLPSKWALGEAAQQQEANLSYVAITRAQEGFTYGAVK